jgi:diguanylate cyclase (GGDEF)-like protein
LETEAGAATTARVLLIEEDARDASLISALLRAAWPDGLVLAHAERFRDATQELLDFGASCVVLSLDASGGLEPLGLVRTCAPDIPIIVLSEGGDEEFGLRAVRAGAQDYLVKADMTSRLLRRSVANAIERNRSEVQLAQRALHDPLTGLPNRALFLDRLGVALDRSRRTGTAVAVLFLDVDDFKRVNDVGGHAAGDRLLAGLGERLRTMLRPMDTVARFGGDEFTFLFEDLTSERETILIAERIGHAARLPIALPDGDEAITVSIGIAIVRDPGVVAESVIREADAAMYRAKELGRARYELYDETSRQRAMERIELESDLRTALERSELRVHYQPRVALNGSERLLGFEALVRWDHPQRGLLSPAEFMPLAEETGLVLAIGQHVAAEALQAYSRFSHTDPALTISINISARELGDVGLLSMLSGTLSASHTDPNALSLEVSEKAVAQDSDTAHRVLGQLKAAGIGLVVDDYGTGCSSLQSLERLPVDTIKIHESFIQQLGQGSEQKSVVGAIVELAHALGLSATAEGVETAAQREQLTELGCDAAQGFLFGAPVPVEEAEALVTSRA